MPEIENAAILVAEDNPVIRTLIITILKKGGFLNYTEVEDGQKAWEQIQKKNYDLVLTDLRMPNMDGIQLLEMIRSGDEPIKNTPVLMITSMSGEKDVQHAVKLKVNGYIVKPFTEKSLTDKIYGVLR